MKSFFTSAATVATALFFSLTSFAQDQPLPMEEGKVDFTEVLELDGKESDLFEAAKAWVLSNKITFERGNPDKSTSKALWTGSTNNSNVDLLHKNDNPLKYESKDEGTIIGRVTNKYNASNLGCLRTVYLDYDFVIYVKKGKAKYEVTNFVYSSYNHHTNTPMPVGGSGKKECSEKGPLENLLVCPVCDNQREKLFAYIKEDTAQLIDSFKKGIAKKNNKRDF